MAIQSVYLRSVYEVDVFQKTVNKTVTVAEELHKKYKFDTIAFCGMSGAAMAFLLSHRLGVHLICVRKPTDGSHFHSYWASSKKITLCEGNMSTEKYLIVDDFITTGGTVDRIVRTIRTEVPKAVCVGMLMYAESHGRNWTLPDGVGLVEVTPSGLERS